MMNKYLFLLYIVLNTYCTASTQETISNDHPQIDLTKAMELFKHREYGLSTKILEKYVSHNLHNSTSNLVAAEILLARAKLKMQLDNADIDLSQVLLKYSGVNEASSGYYDLANHYFANKEYDKSIKYYALTKDKSLQEEINYKTGYAHFVKKDFAKAKYYFSQSLNEKGPYFYNLNYYHGMCSYFEKDYSSALKSFRRVENNSQYQKYIPYYITQIHFAKNEYDQLISYAESKSNDTSLKNQNRIRLLLGQSYFKKGNYTKALDHLEYYESTTDKLSKEEFYQLAYTQYQNKRWKKAGDNFKELTNLDSKMGQLSNYYLGDCYLKQNDKASARTAFKRVSGLSYDLKIQEEALFNYGKLSVEEGYDAQAISALSSFKQGSTYYNPAQSVLSELFLRTKDYDRSITSLEGINNKSAELKSAYQVVSLAGALQAYEDNDIEKSKRLLDKSLKSPTNPHFKSQSIFWKALILQEEGKTAESISAFKTYFSSNPNKNLMPADASPAKANYYQGYNYLKNADYKNAYTHFKNANDNSLTGAHQTDMITRTGDCLFGLNEYSQAKFHYDQVKDKDPTTAAYAIFQSSIIDGLEGNTYEKIVLLDDLLKKYPKSEYVDDALLELGDSYTVLGEHSEAFNAYEKLILEHQDKSTLINQALIKLGLSSFNQGDVQSAMKYYKKVMLNNPTAKESKEALAAIEEIYVYSLGQSKEYLDYLDDLPDYDLDDSSRDSLNYKIAELQYENSEYTKSIKGFSEYLKEYPNGRYVIPATFYRAESNTYLKMFSEALPDYEAVIDKGVNPFYETSILKASIISLNELKDYDKAYTYSTALLNFTTDLQLKHQAEFNAMQSAYFSNRLEEAHNLAQPLLNNQLSNTEDKVAANFVIGKYSVAKNDTGKAISAFNYVIQNNNGALSAESSYLLSQLYFNANKLEEAEQQCKQTNSLSGNYPFWIAKSLMLLSDIYVQKNDLFNARAATEAVIENFQEDAEILAEAKEQLRKIEEKENRTNRILDDEENGLLKLDNGN